MSRENECTWSVFILKNKTVLLINSASNFADKIAKTFCISNSIKPIFYSWQNDQTNYISWKLNKTNPVCGSCWDYLLRTYKKGQIIFDILFDISPIFDLPTIAKSDKVIILDKNGNEIKINLP